MSGVGGGRGCSGASRRAAAAAERLHQRGQAGLGAGGRTHAGGGSRGGGGGGDCDDGEDTTRRRIQDTGGYVVTGLA